LRSSVRTSCPVTRRKDLYKKVQAEER
jgi:hypothetical protein